jgi:3'(2'), 5'-bisphosphate nucleotidase
MLQSNNKMVEDMKQLAIAASELIMGYYNNHAQTMHKSDNSPVTIADIEANNLIEKGLREKYPAIPLISEEGDKRDWERAKAEGKFFCIDPLDGTKGFIKGSGEFTVNIAYIENYEPALGVIIQPATGDGYYTKDGKAFYFNFRCHPSGGWDPENKKLDSSICWDDKEREIKVSNKTRNLIAVMSSSHGKPEEAEMLGNYEIAEYIKASSSLKLCMIAAGKADIYPRYGTTMEWDIAAGHAILNAAGGRIINPDGTPFRYGKEACKNGAFLALGFENKIIMQNN